VKTRFARSACIYWGSPASAAPDYRGPSCHSELKNTLKSTFFHFEPSISGLSCLQRDVHFVSRHTTRFPSTAKPFTKCKRSFLAEAHDQPERDGCLQRPCLFTEKVHKPRRREGDKCFPAHFLLTVVFAYTSDPIYWQTMHN